MRKFILGLAFGLALGIAGTAVAAEVVGIDSYLFGWDVLKGDDVVCKDPWMNVANKLVSCK